MTNGSLMKVESVAECSACNTFDLHLAIIGIENQILVFLRIADLHRFYCTYLPESPLDAADVLSKAAISYS